MDALKTSPEDFTYGWISPEGELFGCSYMEHGWLASKITEKRFGLGCRSSLDAEKHLEERGWIHVGTKRDASFFSPEGISTWVPPTKKQVEAIQSIGLYTPAVEQRFFELELMKKERGEA